MNFKKAVEHLDGMAVANVDEPSKGDLERVLKNQSKLKIRITELEIELARSEQRRIEELNAHMKIEKQLDFMAEKYKSTLSKIANVKRSEYSDECTSQLEWCIQQARNILEMKDISAYELNLKSIIRLANERDALQTRVKELEEVLYNTVHLGGIKHAKGHLDAYCDHPTAQYASLILEHVIDDIQETLKEKK